MIDPRKDLSCTVAWWLGIRLSEVMVLSTDNKKILMASTRSKKGEDIDFCVIGEIHYILKLGIFEIKECQVNYKYKRVTKARRIIN